MRSLFDILHVLFAASIFAGNVTATRSDQGLNVHLTSGWFDNYLYRSNITSAQVLFNNVSGPMQRFVVALSAGNSGALAYFLPLQGQGSGNETNPNATLGVTLVNGTIRDAMEEFDNVGVQGEMLFSNDASLGVTVLGAVRAMRDYVEGDGTMHPIFNYTVAAFNSSSLHLHRKWINSSRTLDLIMTSNNMNFTVTLPPTNETDPLNTAQPTAEFRRLNGSETGRVSWKLVCNETTIPGTPSSSLFLKPSDAKNDLQRSALTGLADGSNQRAQEVSFMSFQTKSVAGGWRFLTYFGRDTLIALRLLSPIMTVEASESVLGAVLDRLNSTGAAAHEETVGDYASFVNIGNNRTDLGDTPFYDYKMIDTDLLLLPTFAHVFLDLPQSSQPQMSSFLSRAVNISNPNQNTSYLDLLQRNAQYVLERAQPFASSPTVTNLLHLREGQPVGNWRDSNQGLGYGTIPFDVNTALVPAALRALARLSDAGALPKNMSTNATQTAEIWELCALPLFKVPFNQSVVEERLDDFVAQVNLSTALLPKKIVNTTLYALSLHDDGTPVDIMHSDLGFNLLYSSNVQAALLWRVVDALKPYPTGLLTDIGMLCANPALSSNRTQINVLDRTAYHGTVVWSFQQALMAAGLVRQLKLCDSSLPTIDIEPTPSEPSWCKDTKLISALMKARTDLWNAINGAKEELFSEVWSYSFDNSTNQFAVADLGAISPSGTEADAIQLWSFTFLAIADLTKQ